MYWALAGLTKASVTTAASAARVKLRIVGASTDGESNIVRPAYAQPANGSNAHPVPIVQTVRGEFAVRRVGPRPTPGIIRRRPTEDTPRVAIPFTAPGGPARLRR